jgi:hypothetical protein
VVKRSFIKCLLKLMGLRGHDFIKGHVSNLKRRMSWTGITELYGRQGTGTGREQADCGTGRGLWGGVRGYGGRGYGEGYGGKGNG